jgi:hypothetical protein
MRSHSFALILPCALLALTIAHPDANAGVYKIVGPDGKVSFSDKPPPDAATTDKIDVIRTQTAPLSSAIANSTSAASPSGSNTAPKGNAKSPLPSKESSSNIAIASYPDSAIEKAIIGVLGYEDLVRQTETLCVRTLPSSSQKYSGAADGWRSRNAALVTQARQALAAQFSSAQRQTIESGVRIKNNASLAPVDAAPTASRISWCDSSTDAIRGGTMDVHNKTNLSAPLLKTGS